LLAYPVADLTYYFL